MHAEKVQREENKKNAHAVTIAIPIHILELIMHG
jgi:hypothetical protein